MLGKFNPVRQTDRKLSQKKRRTLVGTKRISYKQLTVKSSLAVTSHVVYAGIRRKHVLLCRWCLACSVSLTIFDPFQSFTPIYVQLPDPSIKHQVSRLFFYALSSEILCFASTKFDPIGFGSAAVRRRTLPLFLAAHCFPPLINPAATKINSYINRDTITRHSAGGKHDDLRATDRRRSMTVHVRGHGRQRIVLIRRD